MSQLYELGQCLDVNIERITKGRSLNYSLKFIKLKLTATSQRVVVSTEIYCPDQFCQHRIN